MGTDGAVLCLSISEYPWTVKGVRGLLRAEERQKTADRKRSAVLKLKYKSSVGAGVGKGAAALLGGGTGRGTLLVGETLGVGQHKLDAV